MNPKLKAAVQLGSTLAGAYGLQRRIREARADKDKLALADAIITGLGLVTGTALALRALRKGEDK